MPEGPAPRAFAACVRTPFATLGISATATHVTGVRFLSPESPSYAPPRNSLAYLACLQVQAYLDDPRASFDLPLALAGTHHRIAVWEALQRIPSGATVSYGELARELGSSPRAVGGACGANPIPLIVPCHRVLAAGGRIGGFMGAAEPGFELGIKRWLLGHEGAR